MAGLSALHGKLRTLKNISLAKSKGQQVSVVYFDVVDGERIIDWPETPNSSGVLVVPKPCKCLDEWQANQER